MTQADRQINNSMTGTQEILAPVLLRDNIVEILKRKAGPCGRVGVLSEEQVGSSQPCSLIPPSGAKRESEEQDVSIPLS